MRFTDRPAIAAVLGIAFGVFLLFALSGPSSLSSIPTMGPSHNLNYVRSDTSTMSSSGTINQGAPPEALATSSAPLSNSASSAFGEIPSQSRSSASAGETSQMVPGETTSVASTTASAKETTTQMSTIENSNSVVTGSSSPDYMNLAASVQKSNLASLSSLAILGMVSLLVAVGSTLVIKRSVDHEKGEETAPPE